MVRACVSRGCPPVVGLGGASTTGGDSGPAAVGLIPGIGLVRRLREQHLYDPESAGPGTPIFTYPLHIAWAHLAVVIAAAPLLAAAAAALLHRSTPPSEIRHRAEG